MADSKYGRLFTEADVRALIAREFHVDDPEDQADVLASMTKTTFPPDEPLFLLRGQDLATPDTIAAYVTRVVELGGAGPHTRAVGDIYIRVRDWQIEHPDRVKAPD